MFSLLSLLLLFLTGMEGGGGVSVVPDRRESESLKRFWN